HPPPRLRAAARIEPRRGHRADVARRPARRVAEARRPRAGRPAARAGGEISGRVPHARRGLPEAPGSERVTARNPRAKARTPALAAALAFALVLAPGAAGPARAQDAALDRSRPLLAPSRRGDGEEPSALPLADEQK